MKTGKWICYPGDFEIMLAEKVMTRRYQRDFPIGPFWRMDSPWHNVKFYKEFHLEKPDVLHFFYEGRISVYFYGIDRYSYEFDGTISLPAGDYKMEIWVYNKTGLPCLRIDGDGLVTDETFSAAYNQFQLKPCFVCPCDVPPNEYALPRRAAGEFSPAVKNGETYFDLGRMAFVFLTVKGKGKYRLYFGETLGEIFDEEHCEQVEFFDLGEGGEHTSETSKAFRYLRVLGAPAELSAEEEYLPAPAIVRFESEDKELEEIFSVALNTFTLCKKEFYLDGIKRDRWLWGGDAYQAYKIEDYFCFDTDMMKRCIIALFGKSPVCTYINHIMDYTLYTILSVWEYYLKTGDEAFVRYIEPILSEHLAFVLSRTNEDGFLYKQEHDWVFVDWGLSDTDGEQSFEQILLHIVLTAVSRLYALLKKDASHIDLRAEKLKKKINEVFWDEKRGLYLYSRVNGAVPKKATVHANAFAVLYGFAEGKKAERIKRAILSGEAEPSITPYMQMYSFAGLFECGAAERADAELRAYWGGMVKLGVSTFWETYTPGESVEDSAPMYGRPFGRSHCHIWGSGPLYLIPRYYFGVTSENFGQSFTVKPNLSLLKSDCSIVLPLKRGTLEIKISKDGVRVSSSELGGRLVLGEKEYLVKKGEPLYVAK